MSDRIRPFLKWAGNKYRVIDRIVDMLPSGTRLVEPFAGSAAVFLNTSYKRYHLSDTNSDLIQLYKLVKNEGSAFIDYARKYFRPRYNTADSYYRLREKFNSLDDPVEKSALFIYLNRHGYNGLCRYNKSGIYNVPFGKYKKPYFPTNEMEAFHVKSRHASFKVQDFAMTLRNARKGDVVYCDPPYVPLSDTANFTSYASNGFNSDDQELLASMASKLASRGVSVLISNHHTAFTRRMYKAASADIVTFKVQRFISCKGNHRRQADEVLALFR